MKYKLSVGSSTVQVYCSPHPSPELDPLPALLKLVNGAKTSIFVGAYSFTSVPLAQALIAKHQAGVAIRIAADRVQYTNGSQYAEMTAAGIDLRIWGGQFNLQHMKAIVVDAKQVAWGSYNFSGSAEKGNYEVMTTTANAKLAAILTTQIQAVYDKGTTPA